ncbi:MAG: toxin-antitoxin system, antitoxin component, Xre family protein [Lachnospiraceae bacterium]|nr:toxin-antitoxin system, antitoxin component, Xre family protein [Lachnospiraceae bacterium]
MANTLYVDTELLDEAIEKSGLKIDYLVSTLGISRAGFYQKRNGAIPFKAAEVFTLCSLLNITDDKHKIFYPKG